VLHQVGVSFDLYCDARKHKIKKKNSKFGWDRPVPQGTVPGQPMYHHACISASTGRIFMKIHVWYSAHIRKTGHKFSCDRSLIKGAFLGEEYIFHGCISGSIAGISIKLISCTKSL